ncbi:MAG: hypothetical protein ACP5M5_14200 [Acidibrevibacterium sp.]|uniref:hypothetical protein n=1 Tax=Acidibrevibacterium sp. TaxID=2606776 RepID=UPI003D046E53
MVNAKPTGFDHGSGSLHACVMSVHHAIPIIHSGSWLIAGFDLSRAKGNWQELFIAALRMLMQGEDAHRRRSRRFDIYQRLIAVPGFRGHDGADGVPGRRRVGVTCTNGAIFVPRLLIIQPTPYHSRSKREPYRIRKRMVIGAVAPYLAALASELVPRRGGDLEGLVINNDFTISCGDIIAGTTRRSEAMTRKKP